MSIKGGIQVLLLAIQIMICSVAFAANTSLCVVGPQVCFTNSKYQMGNSCLCSDKDRILKGSIMAVNVSSLCKVTGRDQQCQTAIVSIGTECICDAWVGYAIAQ